jgi:hypothetical protein
MFLVGHRFQSGPSRAWQVAIHNGNHQLQKSYKNFSMAVLEAVPGRAEVRVRGSTDGHSLPSATDVQRYKELQSLVRVLGWAARCRWAANDGRGYAF